MAEYTEEELDTIYNVFDRVNNIMGTGTLPHREADLPSVPDGVFGFTDTANNELMRNRLENDVRDIGSEYDIDPYQVHGYVSTWFSKNGEPDPLPREPRIKYYNDMATQLEYVDRLKRAMTGTGGDLPLSAQIADRPENLAPPYGPGSPQLRGPMRVEVDPRNNMTVRRLFRGSVQVR